MRGSQYQLIQEFDFSGNLVQKCSISKDKRVIAIKYGIDYYFYQNEEISCSVSNCYSCKNLTHCYICEENYYDLEDGSCGTCLHDGCLSCSSLIYCDICDENNSYFKNSSNECERCSI